MANFHEVVTVTCVDNAEYLQAKDKAALITDGVIEYDDINRRITVTFNVDRSV